MVRITLDFLLDFLFYKIIIEQINSPTAYLQAESPYPRQSHSLVNSTKPGAWESPLPARTGNRKTTINS